MAGYDIFTQARGPDISISLFGDAASQGANIAKSLGNETSAAITGAIEGYQQGQQIQLNQAKIDQIPVQQQLDQAQLEHARLANEILQLDKEIAVNTQDAALRAKKAELERVAQTSAMQAKDLENRDLLLKDLGSNDPAVRKGVLTDPRFGRILLDPALAEQVAGRLAGTGDLTPEDKDKLFEIIDFSKARENEQRLKEIDVRYQNKVSDDLAKTTENVAKSGQLTQVMNQFGMKNVSELAALTKTYPERLKNYTPEGMLDPSQPDNDITVGGAPVNRYEVVVNGKKANIILSEESNKLLQDLQHGMKVQGLLPSVAEERQTPAVTPTPDAGKPFSQALLGSPQASATATTTPAATEDPRFAQNHNITMQRRRELEANPVLRDRLRAKEGTPPPPIVPQGVDTLSRSTPTATPAVTQPAITGTPAPPTVPVPTNVPSEVQTNKGAAVPQATPAPSYVKPVLFELQKVLPQSVKRYANTDVMARVITNPHLQGLAPIYQALAAVESSGNTDAKAKKTTATGLFQLTKDAATDASKILSKKEGKPVSIDPKNPEENIKGGIAYFNQLLSRYGGSEIPAIMAYHIGAGIVDDAIDVTNSNDLNDLLFGIQYLHDRGMWSKILTPDTMRDAKTYTFKVLAYKQAFGAYANV